MKRVFSKSFRETLKKSKNSVEVAGSGVTNVFPSTRKISSVPSDGAKWLRHFAVYLIHKGRGNKKLVCKFLVIALMLGPHSQVELVGWTPDKGSIKNERQRQKNKAPALVATGKYVPVVSASQEHRAVSTGQQ